MKNILLFGAGKSATVLIDYLLQEAIELDWMITVADTNRSLIEQKLAGHSRGRAIVMDLQDEVSRKQLVAQADLVISMMPPALHMLVAKDCLYFGKSLLTASYVDAAIQELDQEAKEKGILFLCEMGLDPGIDHMSAMKLIHEIQQKGGLISSFKSHCGGLVAPESDDNPWHYKISWNPRNVVLAGKAGAIFREQGQTREISYAEMFRPSDTINISGIQSLSLSYYPNRNSLPYIDLYGLQDASNFIRTTLRYPDFIKGWKVLMELQLTDETPAYATDGMHLAEFFKQHFAKHGLEQKLDEIISRELAETRIGLSALEEKIDKQPGMVTQPELEEAANKIQQKVNEANKLMDQLRFLGLQDTDTIINKGWCSAADVLQFMLEQKLVLHEADKDMIVMLHELEYELNGKKYQTDSSLVVIGKDHLRTAMAKTVGLPLGIAAKLILTGALQQKGVMIPNLPEIYLPVLSALEHQGVRFEETTTLMSAN